MSSNISPREVLAYLNELGYQNISAAQLKEFMIDLKKLIKHKEQAHSTNIENVPLKVNRKDAHDESETQTKNTRRKESVISIQFKPYSNIPVVTEMNNDNSQEPSTNSLDCRSVQPRAHSECTKSQKTRVQFDGNILVSKASYIIPHNPVKTCKSDPVALYHKYQAGWKRQKAPGEDDHANLRWAIRERMIGQPRIRSSMSAAPSMEVIAKNRKTTTWI